MLRAALTPRRKVALALALPWFVISTGVVFYTSHQGAGLPFLLLHWPFALTAGWTILSAMTCGILVAELARMAGRTPATWSDKRHFAVALVVASVCLAIQWASLVLAAQGVGARAF
jgi:hypothetical protein